MPLCESCQSHQASVIINADGWDGGERGFSFSLCEECAIECLRSNADAKRVSEAPLCAGDRFVFGNWAGAPIEWRVLKAERNRLLVLSERGLDCVRFNGDVSRRAGFEGSDLEAWLYDFVCPTFFGGGVNRIIKATVLTIEEAEGLFEDEADRICRPSAYARAQGVWEHDNGGCFWWLRSPVREQECAAVVFPNGFVYSLGAMVDASGIAVRPALWLKR